MMTDDLYDRFRRAADPGDRRPRTTPAELLARGRRDRRRHRVFAAGGGTAVAAVTLGAMMLGYSSLPGSGDPDRPDSSFVDLGDESPGRYVREPVSEKEAVRRCGLQVENSDLVYDLVRDGEDWRRAPYDWSKPHRWRIDPDWKQTDPNWSDTLVVGGFQPMETRLDGDFVEGDCVIPEADLAADSGRIQGDVVDAGDHDGILRQCGEIAGYDFTGWEVMSAMGSLDGVEAMLQSTNDHAAGCRIEAPGKVYHEHRVGISEMSDADVTEHLQHSGTASPYCVVLDSQTLDKQNDGMAPDEGEAAYSGSSNLYRSNGKLAVNITELRFELPDGSVVTQEVRDAKWAVRFAYEMPAGGPIPVTMLDADGNVVAERDNAMNGRC